MKLDRGSLGPSWFVVDGVVRTAGSETERLDCAWAPTVEVRPGEVNAHTHLYSGLAGLGMPAPEKAPANFVEILQRIWWRLDRALDAKALEASARYAIAEGLLWGTTALVDHHESPNVIEGSLDVLADAAESLGVRLAVGYGATERNGGREEARRGLEECARFLRSNRRPNVRGLVALHASFTVSDETIREAGALTRALRAPMHVHVAEDLADVEDAKRRGFAGPLERLLELDALPAGSVVAHGVHLGEAQVERLDAAGAWLVQNPRSNEGNRVGYPHALAKSRHVALGTDGWPSEMRLEREALFRLGAQHGEARSALEARAVEGRALVGSLFGGAFEAVRDGATADLIIGEPDQRPRHVLVGGRVVVKDGVLQTADLEAVRAHAKELAPELWRRMSSVA